MTAPAAVAVGRRGRRPRRRPSVVGTPHPRRRPRRPHPRPRSSRRRHERDHIRGDGLHDPDRRGGAARPGDAAASSKRRRAWTRGRSSQRLSRFRPDSELCALNADPRPVVPASPLLRAAVGAGLWAAERTGGLVDPTLVGALEAAGYATRAPARAGAPLAEALAERAAARARPRPTPRARWRTIAVDDEPARSRRPPGVRFDTGGTGKGLAADLLAAAPARLRRASSSTAAATSASAAPRRRRSPFEVDVEHPLTGERAHVLRLGAGGVATSGLDVASGAGPDGTLRPPPARPRDRRARLDRAGRRDRARAHGARGRDARQGGAALRARGARRLLAEHGGLLSTTTARSSPSARSLARRSRVRCAAALMRRRRSHATTSGGSPAVPPA